MIQNAYKKATSLRKQKREKQKQRRMQTLNCPMNKLMSKSSPWSQHRKTPSGRKTCNVLYSLTSIQKGYSTAVVQDIWEKATSPKKQEIDKTKEDTTRHLLQLCSSHYSNRSGLNLTQYCNIRVLPIRYCTVRGLLDRKASKKLQREHEKGSEGLGVL